MKNLLFFLLGGLLAFNVNAQTPPVAVNDTVYVNYEQSRNFVNLFKQNDYHPSGQSFFIDTIIYTGVHQLNVVYLNLPSPIGAITNSHTYTPNAGFFGLDSLQYSLISMDGGVSLFATVYIYVKRKSNENLDINNINASIDKDKLFYQPTSGPYSPGSAGFNVPKSTNVSTIYTAEIWLAGRNSSNEVVTNISKYFTSYLNSSGNAGPIMNKAEYDFYSYQWDRVWKVNQTDLDYHTSNYSAVGYVPIEVIANWPAHGDVGKGQAANLAPFVDVDNNGIYNPLNGDYPKIKGQQAIYFITNSDRDTSIYLGKKLRAEVHGMAYAYDCPSDSALYNTVFVNYKVYNRSNSIITDAYLGEWIDFDIGNPADDYFGCDVSRGAFYSYNSDSFDEASAYGQGYGNNPPVQGVLFLKGPKEDNDGLDNPITTNIQHAIDSSGIPYANLGVGYGDGIVDNEYSGMEYFSVYASGDTISVSGEPKTNFDCYQYLQGKWKNNAPITWGGNGDALSTGSIIPSKYIYPIDSDPLHWSTYGVSAAPTIWEETVQLDLDRRGVGSSGPFTMPIGGMVELDLAFVFGRDYQNPGNKTGIPVMQERMDSIRNYFNYSFPEDGCPFDAIPEVEVVVEVIPDSFSIIIPNVFTPNGDDFNDNFVIQLKGTNLLESVSFQLFNRWGAQIKELVFNIDDLPISTTNYEQQLTVWDGRTTTGTITPEGTYYYIVTYTTTKDEKDVVKGYLTLLR